MPVDANQTIAGFPSIEIRRLLRDANGVELTLRHVQKGLHCPKRVAAAVLIDLERGGYITSANGHLEILLKGSALAQATAAKPLRRKHAEQLVAELVERARIVNADNAWAYRVDMLVVFGGFASGAERPNDIDIGCRLAPRWTVKPRRSPKNVEGNSTLASSATQFTMCIGLSTKSCGS